MAKCYWITFCLSESGNEERRCQALLAAIRRLTSDGWWTESVNFVLFRSEHAIDPIAAEIGQAIDPDIDLVLIANVGAEEARAIGAVGDARLFELMPWARRVRGPAVRRVRPILPAA